MAVVVWVVEGTWPAGVDAARTHAPAGADIVLLHVSDQGVANAAHGAFAGLLGRDPGHDPGDPGTRLERMTADSAHARRCSSARLASAGPRTSARTPSCPDRPGWRRGARLEGAFAPGMLALTYAFRVWFGQIRYVDDT
jgi:hypothetical protein